MKTERINGEREKVMSKILIVEDEEAIADLEKDYLELSDSKSRSKIPVIKGWRRRWLESSIW